MVAISQSGGSVEPRDRIWSVESPRQCRVTLLRGISREVMDVLPGGYDKRGNERDD